MYVRKPQASGDRAEGGGGRGLKRDTCCPVTTSSFLPTAMTAWVDRVPLGLGPE